jgi:type IV pilus assembly protein PilN
MRITINLASRPYADLGPAIKRLRIGMAVLAALCIGLGLGLHAVHNKADAARAREQALDRQLDSVSQERQGYMRMMQQPQNAQLLAQVAELNQLFDEKQFSWTLAMENLETVLPGGVMVTTLEPVRAKNGQITLHLRVVGPHDLGVELVRNLEHSRRFLHPRIVGENAESAANGANEVLQPVSESSRFDFDLLAEYNPPGPDEEKSARAGKKEAETAAAPEAGADGNPRASRAQRLQPAAARERHPYTGQTMPQLRKPNPATTRKPLGGGR